MRDSSENIFIWSSFFIYVGRWREKAQRSISETDIMRCITYTHIKYNSTQGVQFGTGWVLAYSKKKIKKLERYP